MHAHASGKGSLQSINSQVSAASLARARREQVQRVQTKRVFPWPVQSLHQIPGRSLHTSKHPSRQVSDSRVARLWGHTAYAQLQLPGS